MWLFFLSSHFTKLSLLGICDIAVTITVVVVVVVAATATAAAPELGGQILVISVVWQPRTDASHFVTVTSQLPGSSECVIFTDREACSWSSRPFVHFYILQSTTKYHHIWCIWIPPANRNTTYILTLLRLPKKKKKSKAKQRQKKGVGTKISYSRNLWLRIFWLLWQVLGVTNTMTDRCVKSLNILNLKDLDDVCQTISPPTFSSSTNVKLTVTTTGTIVLVVLKINTTTKALMIDVTTTPPPEKKKKTIEKFGFIISWEIPDGDIPGNGRLKYYHMGCIMSSCQMTTAERSVHDQECLEHTTLHYTAQPAPHHTVGLWQIHQLILVHHTEKSYR